MMTPRTKTMNQTKPIPVDIAQMTEPTKASTTRMQTITGARISIRLSSAGGLSWLYSVEDNFPLSEC